MHTKYSLLVLITLLSFDSFAQQADFEWSWATRGGGPRDLASNAQSPPATSHSQKVNAIAVDNGNNYYFIADIGSPSAPSTETTFGNIPNDTIAITTYNDPSGSNYYSKDTYLVSTDCKGEFRWHKTIGGGGNVNGVDIKADALDGVYITGQHSISTSWQTPVHYDQDSIKGMPVGNNNPSPNNKAIYLIKYNANGDFEWVKEPESDNTALPFQTQGGVSVSRGIAVEPDGTIHWLIDLKPWHTYENEIIVPDSTYMNGRYIGDTGVLKYDKDGNFINYLKLDINMIAQGNYFGDFTYDPNSNQYYLAARQDNSINGGAEMNGTVVTGDYYLAAFNANNGDVVWWHEGDGGFITAMDIDDSGNIYLTGACTPVNNNSFAGYTFTHSGASRAFLMKLNSDGQLQWGTNAETNSPNSTSVKAAQNEVVVGMGFAATIGSHGWHWDGLEYIRPSGYGIDPGILRFDKQSGAALAIHDIMGAGTGSWDITRAVAVDKLGNIIAGGMMTSPHIFNNHPVVPQLDRMAVSKSDFFIAQLAKAGVSCDDLMSVGEVQRPQMRIYPNPAGNILHWQAEVGIIAISLYDISGRVVKEQATSGQTGSISLEGLSAGSYIVVLRDDTGKSLHKVLVKK